MCLASSSLSYRQAVSLLVTLCSILLYLVPGSSSAFHPDWGLRLQPHSCDRDCNADSRSMECVFNFDIETYSTMSTACYLCPHNISHCSLPECVAANGLKRLILTVNKQIPGPPIRVCEGDTVIVNVSNHLYNFESTSMHWHGIHQRGTNHMDGVAQITQCGILPYNKWTYKFEAFPAGTHFYHAHAGPQRADGVYGPLIVNERKAKLTQLYDYDKAQHTLIVVDFDAVPSVEKQVLRFESMASRKTDFILINGQGAGDVIVKPSWYEDTEGIWVENTTPRYKMTVSAGKKYRFRIISAAANCPIEVFIQNHTFTVISSEGGHIEPFEADVLNLSGGERWDIVVSADQPVANYWLYARGLHDCREKQQTAILSYEGSDSSVLPDGVEDASTVRESYVDALLVVNPLHKGMINPSATDNLMTLTELSSPDGYFDDWISQEPDNKFYLAMDLYNFHNERLMNQYTYSEAAQKHMSAWISQVNRISSTLPSKPYLSQYSDIPKGDFCTYSSADNHSLYASEECANEKLCECVHRLKVDTGSVVELIMIDEGRPYNYTNHPMHLHGNHFAVIGLGEMPSLAITRREVIELDMEGKLPRNLTNPILKDNVRLPVGGWLIAKFKANNPGVWFLHCHNDMHVHYGMGIIVQVGEPDEWNVPNNLPRCGSYHYNDPELRLSNTSGGTHAASYFRDSNNIIVIAVLLVLVFDLF